MIISTGKMSSTALNISKEVKRTKLGVIDVYKIKPFSDKFKNKIKKYKKIFCLEEHNEVGGLGSIISNFIHDKRLKTEVIKLSLKQKTIFVIILEMLHKNNSIDLKYLIKVF